MIRVCAWCKKMMGEGNETVDIEFEVSAEISHGCCNACKVVLDKELEEYKLQIDRKKSLVILRPI
jgi:hypothetical protein